jgi:SAM-dependent methyltransferase
MKLKQFFKKLIHVGGTFQCVACDSKVKFFERIGDATRLVVNSVSSAPLGFETLNIDAYYCPVCGANDRDRLILNYLLKNHAAGTKVLEIAPSKAIRAKLLHEAFEYRCCDLYMAGVDDVCDITNMECYSDASFDIVICSHVLEHIHDDYAAVSEVARILKPSGLALILVPIPLGLESSLYDPYLIDSVDRIKFYGQSDHVRMYSSSGLIQLINDSGLQAKFWSSSNAVIEFSKLGLSMTSKLYLAVKN